MQAISFEPRLLPLDSSPESPQIGVAVSAIPQVELSAVLPDFSNIPLVELQFLNDQRSAIRKVSHVAGRHCLALLLESNGIPIIELVVTRDASGKPTLQPDLLSFSIAHDSHLAIAAISDSNRLVGVDIEISNRIIENSVLHQIAKGDQLTDLLACSKFGPERLDGWLLREAVCKAAAKPLSSHAKNVIFNDGISGGAAYLDGESYSVLFITERLEHSEHRICIAYSHSIRS